ncbi:MAG TPA: CBS domain-containing protein [Actinomycetes bacterium]
MRCVVEELMTREVVIVGVDATYREVVALMDRHRVSALPVVAADGRLVGIVSSADLILKQDPAVREELLPAGARAHVEQVKAAATTAGELMTAPVLTVRPHQTVAQAVRLLHHFDVKHLPVVDEAGRLVGIVSRGDLLRVFLRPDEEIEREVTEQVLGQPYVAGNVEVAVRVEGGVVRLEGHARRRPDLEALIDLLHEVDGVVAVDSQVSCMVPEPGVVPLRRP